MSNGNASSSKDLEWMPEYDELLDQIAQTDSVDSEWTHLRDIIKYKITIHVGRYLSGGVDSKDEIDIKKTPEPTSRSSPLPSSSLSPSPFAPSSSPAPTSGPQGLVIPPFPKRERRMDGPMRIHNSIMDEKEANNFKSQIFEQLEDFDSAPFTIQRLCELCVQPKRHYKTVGKYLRAVERTILVTSTRDSFPSPTSDGDVAMFSAYEDNETLRLATTPVFSPIPFLHDDARRSRSPSPFELAAIRRPAGSPGDLERTSVEPPPGRQPLGLVDELDDPKPGHLADHPTALTTVTSTGPAPVAPPLSERFVKSTSPESEDGSKEGTETAESRSAEDAEVEDMVLDTVEEEDKENRPS